MSGQAETRAHLRGPWVYAPASEEGSAVVSPSLDDDSVKVWWTAIITCADDDVANDIARLMHAAPELLAMLVEIRKWMDEDIMGPWDAKFCAEIDALVARATGDAT